MTPSPRDTAGTAGSSLPMPHDPADDEQDIAGDDEEQLGDSCGRWSDDGSCSLAGTEFCDWDCPYAD